MDFLELVSSGNQKSAPHWDLAGRFHRFPPGPPTPLPCGSCFWELPCMPCFRRFHTTTPVESRLFPGGRKAPKPGALVEIVERGLQGAGEPAKGRSPGVLELSMQVNYLDMYCGMYCVHIFLMAFLCPIHRNALMFQRVRRTQLI